MTRLSLLSFIASTVLTALTFSVFGQSTNLTAFYIMNFDMVDTLPICIGYSYDEQVYFGAIYHTDSIVVQEEDTTYIEFEDVYEESNHEKDTSLLLDKKFVKESLLPNAKFIYTLGDNGDTLFADSIHNYLDSDFYPIGLIFKTKNYYGVIYERLFASSGIPSSEKFICTFTKSGKFISRVLIVSFVFSGTGFSKSGARVPWFAYDGEGCINKDLTIKCSPGNQGEKKYKIKKDGKIIELK